MIFTTNDIRIEGSVFGGLKVSFFTDGKYQQDLMHKYSGKDFEVEVREKKPKRSLDANAYLWVLCTKIASHKDIYLSKEEIYQKAIKDYGFSIIEPIADAIVDDVIRLHNSGGLGNCAEVIGKSKLEGYTNLCLTFGSSGYNSAQMSKLIDGVVADAHDLGIETMTPQEIAQLKEAWRGQ